MTLIDNVDQTMKDALRNALTTSDRIDILVGYFYLSGFEELAAELIDKKVRILVGMEIDPDQIPTIVQLSKEKEVDFDRYQPKSSTSSHLKLKSNYVDSLVGFINDSDIFDSDTAEKTLGLFISKIENGSLEIKKTKQNHHSKIYVIHNKLELSHNGDYPGTVIMGSSNFTYGGLVGQGELNDQFREKYKFNEYLNIFNNLWNDSVNIVELFNRHEFLAQIKKKIWIYTLPKPYHMYVRVLDEIFKKQESNNLLTPNRITFGQYADLEYQLDAIKMGIDRINKYDGVIIADVVGLGK